VLGSRVGVDVGSSGVRAVEVRGSRKGRPKIIRAAEVPLERGVVIGGEVQQVEDLTLAIKDLWRVGKFTSRNVTVGMAGNQTLVRQVDLPWEPEEIFRTSLPLRVSQDLPVDPQEMTLDFYPLNQFERGKAVFQRSLIVAAMNAAVENIADSITAAKLQVNKADYTPFALIRTAVALKGDGSAVPGAPEPGEERTCEAIIDVGAQLTSIAIHDRGRPLFVRVVSAGSESVTRALSGHLQLRFEEANIVKQVLGIQGVAAGETGVEALDVISAETVPVAQQIINLMAGTLVQVARESVEYFLAASDYTNSISRVLVSGGGTLLPGYAERLSSELRVPVEILMPVTTSGAGRAKSATALDPRMAVALGLALGAK